MLYFSFRHLTFFLKLINETQELNVAYTLVHFFDCWNSEGPKRRTREGGSEWEPIKILFKNSAYEPKCTRAPPQACLAKFT
jgi:hypothetical protein